MSESRRVLVLGTTGIDKSRVLSRLADRMRADGGANWKTCDFENEFLWKDPRQGRHVAAQRLTYHDNDLVEQSRIWSDAWARFSDKLSSQTMRDVPILLAMHGCVLREHYGARCAFDPRQVAEDFRPDLIITLIDDVYNMWWRTESRAAASENANELGCGRLSLEQIVLARRQELMIGDMIGQLAGNGTRNLMLSVHHPIQTFINAIANPRTQDVIYLSFPISQPREMQEDGDLSARVAVSSFVRAAFERQRTNKKLVIQCPLMIDELPVCKLGSSKAIVLLKKKRGKKPAPVIEFDRQAHRWSLDELWDKDDRLGIEPEQGGPISVKNLIGVLGSIETDVTWRDYRLVEQANRLVVFNPILQPGRKEMAKSVHHEIRYASQAGTSCFVFQDRLLDRKHAVWRALGMPKPGSDDTGTMSPPPPQNLIRMVDSLQDLLNRI